MKFSKKSRYGFIALIDLTVNSQTTHVSLNSIAERNGISLQYLEQVFASLRKAGIVKSIKGPQGGYLLNKDAKKISAAEILEVLEGSYRVEGEELREQSACPEISDALQALLIDHVNQKLDDVLLNLSLDDLANDYLERRQYGQNMYYI